MRRSGTTEIAKHIIDKLLEIDTTISVLVNLIEQEAYLLVRHVGITGPKQSLQFSEIQRTITIDVEFPKLFLHIRYGLLCGHVSPVVRGWRLRARACTRLSSTADLELRLPHRRLDVLSPSSAALLTQLW